jgi:hypothetical protein
VLDEGAVTRQLWIFNSSRSGFALGKELTVGADDTLPAAVVAKDWKVLLQPKLNLGLLPVEKVFLRVVHVPAGTFEETLSMVELQLEKLSPLPTTQIVWSIEILPQRAGNLQTIIVAIVARDLVDEIVGRLEKQGFLPDRLEVPMIDQLQATPITGDGAWIYPAQSTGKFTALVAWWQGGVLRSIGLLHIPLVQNRGELLEAQLRQMMWAGELEGWLDGWATAEPNWHLVADEATARLWQPLFFSWLGEPVPVETTIGPSDLAALTANRAGRAQSPATLLPPDYAERYRQQFINRLWGRGLSATLGLYMLGVFIYFALWGIQSYRTQGVQMQASGLNREYTNTIQLKDKMQILQERQALKYAFLDGWKTIAELLPATLTLQSIEFKDGRTLSLSGVAPADQPRLVADFNDALRAKADANGSRVFDNVEVQTSKLNPGGGTLSWNFTAELAEEEK